MTLLSDVELLSHLFHNWRILQLGVGTVTTLLHY